MRQLFGAMVLALIPGIAGAATITIDFEELSSGPQGIAALVYPDATFTSSTGNIFIDGAGAGKDFCAFNSDQFTCVGILTVDFTSPVSNLTFRTAGEDAIGGLLSNAAVYVNGVFSANVGISYDGIGTSYDPVDLTAFANITRLILTSTDSAGVTWDNFRFDTTPRVPEPSSFALVGLGIAALAARRRAVLRVSRA